MKHGKRKWWPALYALILTAYSVFALLDAFVIPKGIVYAEDSAGTALSAAHAAEEETAEDAAETEETEETAQTETAETSASEAVVTENSYTAEGITIKIDTLYEYDTAIYVAEVWVDDPSRLLTGLANGAFGRNVTATTSEIAESCGAILAINGDYYGFRDTGYVMRNGYLYRTKSAGSSQEDLVIYEDGTMEVICEGDVTAEELAEAGAVQIFSFGPGLISDGTLLVDEDDEVRRSTSSNPRTAIGMVEPGHYIFVVSDGRTDESEGLDLYQLALICQEYGCTVAYNLDGGGSSTMYFNGEVVNNPVAGHKASSGKERSVSDIVYIG